jgi:phytol kinase
MIRNELIRKSVHVSLALGLAVFAPYLGLRGVVGVGAVLLVLFLYTRKKGMFALFRQVHRVTYGEVYFALGILLSAVLFLPNNAGAFQAGMLVLGIADPLSAVVGKLFGRHRYQVWGDTLSYEGSVTCLITSASILMLVGVSWVFALLGGCVLALVEAGSPRGMDNVLLPLIAGALVLVW